MNKGDFVIGTKDASQVYSKTVEDWVGQVMKVRPYREDDIEVRGYNYAIGHLDTFSWVNSKYFRVIGTKTEIIDLSTIKEGDYVQAVTETDSYNNYHLVPGFIAKVVKSRVGNLTDKGSTWDLSVELPDNESYGKSKMSQDWVNSHRFVRIVPLSEEEPNSIDRRTEFEIGSIVECIETHNIERITDDNDEKILKGETFKIIRVDHSDYLDIFVSGINNDKRWWTNSKYFKNLKEKTKMAKKDHMETKSFKIGDYVTAKETFCYDGEKIVKGHRYEVHDCGSGDRIQIDLGPKYWWVPKDKMMPFSSYGSVYTGTEVMLKIKDVIYSNPATIVFWDDGSKTVVRCGKGETFDPEKGLAMAISKRVLGSNYAWHGRFNKWLPKNRAEKKDKSKKTKEETPNE